MRRLLPMKALQVFEVAARYESVTKAARELNVSHSAVSQQIKGLEHHFNQKLFRKKGNGVELTPKARTFLQDIRQGFDILELASENLSSSGVLNRIRVNSTPSFAMRWLIPKVAEFQRENPKIEVRIETSDTDEIEQLSNNFDLIIRRYPMKRAGMSCERLMDDEAVAVMSPRLAELSKIKEPRDLLNCNLLHIKSRISAWPNWFRKAEIQSNETLKGQVFDHFFLSLEAAINGSGVALAPKELVAFDLEEGRLINAFPDISIVGSGFYGLYNGKDRSTYNVEKFINWLSLEDQKKSFSKLDVDWNSSPA